MVDIRQTQKYADYMEKTGWIVERKDNVNYLVKKLPIIGSFIKVQRPGKLNNKKIEKLSNKYRAFQIVVEPKDNKQKSIIEKHGFKLSQSPYLPSKTLHLDLTRSKKELFDNLDKDAKYSLRKAEEIKIYDTQSLEAFHKSWKKAVPFKRAVTPLKKLQALNDTFKESSAFLITPSGSAGAIFLIAADKSYYWQAFTSEAGREELSQYKIVWAGILWAKKRGAKIFDFEGIYDKRFPKKEWKGFTKFKKKFGGREVKYPGAFKKLLLPF